MKIQVMHDKVGKINGIFAPTEGSRQGYIKSLDSNLTVIEVEVPENLSSFVADQQTDIAAALHSLMQDFVIDSGRLVKRSRASTT